MLHVCRMGRGGNLAFLGETSCGCKFSVVVPYDKEHIVSYRKQLGDFFAFYTVRTFISIRILPR